MINVTLPDDKSNYLHRIGRVGRAATQILCEINFGHFEDPKTAIFTI